MGAGGDRGVGEAQIGTHAGLADTSLQLALDPDSVRGAVLRSGARLDESVGIYGGDPRRASAELGRIGVEEIVAQSVSAIRRDLLAAPRGSAARDGAHRTKAREAPREGN
jgi:creatinine amidohydrolase/Fe(II)-dependent formamide hydrolase-like protein